MKILCYSLLSFVLFYHLATNDLDSLQKNVLNKEYVHISVADSRFLLEKQPLHEVPVLCFHNIKGSLRGHWPALTITDDQFMKQIKMLADSGYHSILPDQLYNYLSNGGPLPHKPVMITFDDAYAEHFSIAAPVLE